MDSRHNFIPQTLQHLQSNTPSLQRVSFSASSDSNKKSNISEKLHLPKRVITGKKNQALLDTIPIKEIIIAHKLRDNLKYLSDEICFRNIEDLRKEHSYCNEEKVNQSSNNSNDEYKSVPQINSNSCHSTYEKGPIAFRNVFEFFQNKEIPMTLEDIEIVKDIIELDKRSDNLRKNSKIIKDILKSQLQTILKNESIVDRILKSLDFSIPHNKSFKQLNDISSYSDHNIEDQQFKVDVVFNNIPTLEKEIEVLRKLGGKLEATLRNATLERKRLNIMLQRNIAVRPSKQIQMATEKYGHVKYEVYVLTTEYEVKHSVQLYGLCHLVGVVEEFSISQETIIALKQNSNRQFYIQNNSNSVRWIRTSFKNLMTTPDELFRYIKPTNSQLNFNVLEQDSVFFNNPFHKTLKLSNNHNEKNEFPRKRLCREGADCCFRSISDGDSNVLRKFYNIKSESFANIGSKDLRSTNLFETTVTGIQRRHIRRYLTPIPINNKCTPKNALFKTIFVGLVQMLMFMVLIMALTYPDFKC